MPRLGCLNMVPHRKAPRLFPEKTDSEIGAGNTQEQPETACTGKAMKPQRQAGSWLKVTGAKSQAHAGLSHCHMREKK